jgi:hypothetical protein
LSYNSFWYIGLGILSIIMLLYVMYRTKNYRNFLLFLMMVGTGYIIEFIIYILFGSYQYYPKIILHDPYYDSNLGAIASNLLALPVAATFIAAFQLNWIWIFSLTAYFVGIEWLFLELDIYKHNWWKLGYTAMGLPFYFSLAKWYVKWIMRPINSFTRPLILSLITGSILGTMQILPIMFFNSREYHVGWFENPSRDTTAFAYVFYVAITFLFVLVVEISWKSLILKYTLPTILILIVTMMLKHAGIVEKHVWWDQIYYTLLNFVILILTNVINQKLGMR